VQGLVPLAVVQNQLWGRACAWLPYLWDQVRRVRGGEDKDDDVASPFLPNVISLFLNIALDSSVDIQRLRGP